jgi:putative peptidoglycan lipid II flippase
MVAIFGSIIVCSRLIVAIIWGSRFAGAENILPILVLAVLATNLGLGSVNALTTRSQRGMLVTTASSLSGMVVGAVIWVLAAPTFGLAAVALGYVCGTVVIAGIPIAVVWRKDEHKWGLLFGKVLLGLVVVGVIVGAQHLAHLPLALDPVFAVAFLAVWWLVNRADVARLPIPGLRRRARS